MGFVPDVADEGHTTTSVFERHPRSTAIVLMALAAALVLLLGEAIVRIAMPSVNFLGIDRRLFAPAGEDGYGNAPGSRGAPSARRSGSIERVSARAAIWRGRLPKADHDLRRRFGHLRRGRAGREDLRRTVRRATPMSGRSMPRRSDIRWKTACGGATPPRQAGPDAAPRISGVLSNDVSASSKTEILAAIAGSPASVSAAEGPLATVNAFLRERSKLYLVLKSLLIDSSHRYYSADASRYDDREAMKRALEALEEIKRMLAAREVGFTVLIFPYEYQFRAPDPTTAWRTPAGRQVTVRTRRHRLHRSRSGVRRGGREIGKALANYYFYNDPMHLSARPRRGRRPRRSVVGNNFGSRRSNGVLSRRTPSASSIAILEPHDVVLPEIAARLHLDQVQRHLAGILEPVLRADRDVRRLVLGQRASRRRRGSPSRCPRRPPSARRGGGASAATAPRRASP